MNLVIFINIITYFPLELNSIKRKFKSKSKKEICYIISSESKIWSYEELLSFDLEDLSKIYQENELKNLRLICNDPKELIFCFIIKGTNIEKRRYLMELYIDGTFKTRFWRNSHYCTLYLQQIYLNR